LKYLIQKSFLYFGLSVSKDILIKIHFKTQNMYKIYFILNFSKAITRFENSFQNIRSGKIKKENGSTGFFLL